VGLSRRIRYKLKFSRKYNTNVHALVYKKKATANAYRLELLSTLLPAEYPALVRRLRFFFSQQSVRVFRYQRQQSVRLFRTLQQTLLVVLTRFRILALLRVLAAHRSGLWLVGDCSNRNKLLPVLGSRAVGLLLGCVGRFVLWWYVVGRLQIRLRDLLITFFNITVNHEYQLRHRVAGVRFAYGIARRRQERELKRSVSHSTALSLRKKNACFSKGC